MTEHEHEKWPAVKAAKAATPAPRPVDDSLDWAAGCLVPLLWIGGGVIFLAALAWAVRYLADLTGWGV